MTDPAPEGLRPGSDAACMLCGHSGDPGELRQLGEPPVAVLVCLDQTGCVRRYRSRARRT